MPLVPLELHRKAASDYGGSEPKRWNEKEPTVPFAARQGAEAAEESEPGRGAGHIPVLGLRPGGTRDE